MKESMSNKPTITSEVFLSSRISTLDRWALGPSGQMAVAGNSGPIKFEFLRLYNSQLIVHIVVISH
jgi:hypothetical protein